MRNRGEDSFEERDTFDPWESYSDLYCGLLLVFVLLFFFSIYQYILAIETNNADTQTLQASLKAEQDAVLAIYRADAEDQEAALAQKSEEVERQRSALALVEAEVEDREAEVLQQEQELSALETKLNEQSGQLSAKDAELSEQAAQLSAKDAELSEQSAKLAEQETRLAEQTTLIDQQQLQLEAQAQQIEQVIGVREELIEGLNQQFQRSHVQVQVDRDTGAIVLEGSAMFELNSAELSQEGKEFFRAFLPAYLEVLFKPEYRTYLAEIVIEGHTDERGSYMMNLDLSQRRAMAVAAFCLDENESFLDEETRERLQTLLAVSGCAYRDPIYGPDGSVDEERSRRVEIKFRLKDQEMIEKLDQILNQ